jgi:hypothetical protein
LAVIFSLISSVVLVVAITTGNEMARATSTLTWTVPTSVSNFVAADIEYGNGNFLLVGRQDTSRSGEVGGVRISADGTTWSLPGITPPTDRNWHFAAYGNNMWVIATREDGFASGWIATSADGNTWTERDLSASLFEITSLDFVNGRFMMAANEQNNFYPDIFSSENGTTWTSTNYHSEYRSGDFPVSAVVFGNGRYVVNAFRKMFTSTDLSIWTQITMPSGYDASDLTVNNGTFLVNSNFFDQILKSTNGTDFTATTATHRVTRTEVVGSEWFAFGTTSSSKIYRSSDGIVWTASRMDNDSDPAADALPDRFIGLASSGSGIVAASEGPSTPTGARTVKTTLPPEVLPATQTIAGTSGTAISASTAFTPTNFTGAVTYAVTNGTLPVGLSLNSSTGVVSGTPTAASTATVTITASGATAGTAIATVTFAIAAAATPSPAPAIPTPAPAAPTTTVAPAVTTPAVTTPTTLPDAPQLVTSENQALLVSAPGEATAIVNGKAVAVETIKVDAAATTKELEATGQSIVNILSALTPSGSVNPVKLVKTSDGPVLTGLIVNPYDPTEKLDAPVESVTLVKAGESAVLISAVNITNLPAPIAASGSIEVTRGGVLGARSYGLPSLETGEIVLMSTPRLLQKFIVDKDGSYSGQVVLPRDISIGKHTVVMATKNVKVSLGITLVATKLMFRTKSSIGTRLFEKRAGVKKVGGAVTVTGAGRCKAKLGKITMNKKPGKCFITVKQAAKGTNRAVYSRFTVTVVKKLPRAQKK